MNTIDLTSTEDRPDIFPNKWHLKNVDHKVVKFKTEKINRNSTLITKSRLNSSYWKRTPLKKLIESFGEDWRVSSNYLIICVWDDHQKENEVRIGFINFAFVWDETKLRKISSLSLYVDLIWVRPDKRGLGGVVARHVISHLLFYLETCNLKYPFVSARGVNIEYYAELYSLGGEKVSDIITAYLSYLQDEQYWNIRNIELNSTI